MGVCYIVCIDGRYFEWDSEVAAPITEPMGRIDFERYFEEKHADQPIALRSLPYRLKRVDAKGTSNLDHVSWQETVEDNRAGPGGARLTVEELVLWAHGERELVLAG